ncbi:hypothetical protein GCM10022219_10820 [Microbacterium oryzae]
MTRPREFAGFAAEETGVVDVMRACQRKGRAPEEARRGITPCRRGSSAAALRTQRAILLLVSRTTATGAARA